jgi:hypothetical protein
MVFSWRVSRTLLAPLVGALLLLSLAAVARGAAPASVTVRVEGVNQTVLPPTNVTTTGNAVVKDGNPAHSCSGASAAGALELATSGSWGGDWFESLHGYSVETILGEKLAFEPSATVNYFWSYWLDNKSSTVGICEGELSSGDSVLFFPECFSESEPNPCPPPLNPLGIDAPGSVEAGTPFTVTVTSYLNVSGAPSPAAGVTVTDDGVDATTDAAGQATLALANPGNQLLRVSAPGSVRSEASICVHSGNDGNCGTTSSSAASGGVQANKSAAAPVAYTGPYAIVARATGLLDGHVYSRRAAPRLLSGTVATRAQIASVSLKLRRSYRGRCFAYDGTSERFRKARCGSGGFFTVGTRPSFSYLLPAALGPGRYVLDIRASDSAGNRTSLSRGTSRIVFYVR